MAFGASCSIKDFAFGDEFAICFGHGFVDWFACTAGTKQKSQCHERR